MKTIEIGTVIRSNVRDCTVVVTKLWVDMALETGNVWVEFKGLKNEDGSGSMELSAMIENIKNKKLEII